MCSKFKRKHLSISDERNFAIKNLELLSKSFSKYWDSVLVIHNKEVTTSFQQPTEDAMYTEYRDELDDYVVIDN